MLQTMAPGRATELTGKQVFMLFPTPMFTAVLPELSICDRAEKVIRDLQKAAKGRSSPPGATLAYMTPDDIKTLPEMKELLDIILRESALVLDAFAVKRDSHYIQHVEEHRQSEYARQHTRASELPAERSHLYQDAGELRADDVRFAA